MAKEIFYTGIDLGTSKVCTSVARVSGEGDLQVLGLGIAPTQGIEKGVVVNVQEAAETIKASVDEASRYIGKSLPPAHVAFSGAHISCSSKRGVRNANGSPIVLTREEIRELIRTTYSAPEPGTEILHVIPQSFIIDGLRGVRNPIGLTADEACVEASVVTGSSAAIRNARRAVEKAGVEVDSLVLSSLASSGAVLTEDEKEMGVALVDIGAGTTDIAVFKDGKLQHATSIPVGGYQISRDLSVALGVPYYYAEEAKLRWGCAIPDMVDDSEEVLIPTFQGGTRKTINRSDLCEPIYERLLELMHLIILKLRQAGLERLPAAGLVLTGGTATMPGIEELAKRAVRSHIRIGIPRSLHGLPQDVQSPAYAASVGIIVWSVRHRGERRAYDNRRGVLRASKKIFNRLSTSTESRWKQTRQRLSSEFKKIYA